MKERHQKSPGHTDHSAHQTRLGGSYNGLWNGDTEVSLFHEGHNHRHGTATQGLPSGVLGTLNKSAHQSQHDSGTAL